jgi:type IV secretory pathway TrbD component
MTLIAGAVFIGDLTAVAAIMASLWLERNLGVSRGVVLDWIIVVAVSYGLAAWIVGRLLTRTMARGRTKLPKKADVPLLVECPHK